MFGGESPPGGPGLEPQQGVQNLQDMVGVGYPPPKRSSGEESKLLPRHFSDIGEDSEIGSHSTGEISQPGSFFQGTRVYQDALYLKSRVKQIPGDLDRYPTTRTPSKDDGSVRPLALEDLERNLSCQGFHSRDRKSPGLRDASTPKTP